MPRLRLISVRTFLGSLRIAAIAQPLLIASIATAAPPEPAHAGHDGPAARAGQTGRPDPAKTASNPVRRGIVQIEREGRPIAVGTVLGHDGRVITSLSALDGVSQPELRYADGTVVKTRIGHDDRAWDLALLIPLTGKWQDGLVPSQASPETGVLRSFLPKRGALSAVEVAFRGRVDGRSPDGELLQGALDIDLKGSPRVLGAPVLDGDGKVLGTLTRICKAAGDAGESASAKPTDRPTEPTKKPCATMTIAVPMYALRSFLMATPKDAVAPAPWLGLGGAASTSGSARGVRVMGVAPGGPAEEAGLTAGLDGDTIVAVDGKPVETPEALAEAIGKRGVGDTVKLLVLRGEKLREVGVKLQPTPPPSR